MIDTKRIENLAASPLTFLRGERAEAVANIFLGAEVREEGQILTNVADTPLPRGDIAALLGVVKIFAGDSNAALVWISKPSNAIEQRCFPGARSAKQNCETGQGAKMNIEVESSFGMREALSNADF